MWKGKRKKGKDLQGRKKRNASILFFCQNRQRCWGGKGKEKFKRATKIGIKYERGVIPIKVPEKKKEREFVINSLHRRRKKGEEREERGLLGLSKSLFCGGKKGAQHRFSVDRPRKKRGKGIEKGDRFNRPIRGWRRNRAKREKRNDSKKGGSDEQHARSGKGRRYDRERGEEKKGGGRGKGVPQGSKLHALGRGGRELKRWGKKEVRTSSDLYTYS